MIDKKWLDWSIAGEFVQVYLQVYFAGAFHHFMYRFACLHADAAYIVVSFAPSH